MLVGCTIEHTHIEAKQLFSKGSNRSAPRNIFKRDKLINPNVKREHISDERDTLSYGKIEEKILHICKRDIGYRVQ